jgi:hypothetical protein
LAFSRTFRSAHWPQLGARSKRVEQERLDSRAFDGLKPAAGLGWKHARRGAAAAGVGVAFQRPLAVDRVRAFNVLKADPRSLWSSGWCRVVRCSSKNSPAGSTRKALARRRLLDGTRGDDAKLLCGRAQLACLHPGVAGAGSSLVAVPTTSPPAIEPLRALRLEAISRGEPPQLREGR